MPESLVRVRTGGVRRSGTPEFEACVREFVTKMGGAKLVLGAILKSQPNSSELLFDNSVTVVRKTNNQYRLLLDEEDPNRCM